MLFANSFMSIEIYIIHSYLFIGKYSLTIVTA